MMSDCKGFVISILIFLNFLKNRTGELKPYIQITGTTAAHF